MKWLSTFLCLFALASAVSAQELVQADNESVPAAPVVANPALVVEGTTIFNDAPARAPGGFISGNHNFLNFIGFMSNPLFAVDPRAVTEAIPLNLTSWTHSPSVSLGPIGPPPGGGFGRPPNQFELPSGTVEIPGVAANIALSERISVGLTQGGYAWADFSNSLPRHAATNNQVTRKGWLNLGGFGQVTVIEDVQDQFIVTTGLHWTAPIGSQEIFQGHGPADLAPYITVGKEFGNYHLLGTFGYDFPCGSSNPSLEFFYTTLHVDRRCWGWLYPLMELNWVEHSATVNVSLTHPITGDFIDLGSFGSSGNIVTLSLGANAVLVPEKVELGGAYTFSVSTEHGFDVNAVLFKMIYRF